MKKVVMYLMVITIISKVFGFTRDIILSYFYGASNISDAYLISLSVPNVLFAVIVTGISTGYIPMYTNILHRHGENTSNEFTNNLINIILVVCTLITIIGLVFTKQIVLLFASGFDEETLELAITFAKISIFGIYFIGLVRLFSGFLQIKGMYAIPALIGIPMNIVIIISIFFSDNNILILSIGTLIATVSQLILLIPFIYKKGYRYKLTFNLKDKYIKKITHIVLPVIFGVSVNQINIIIDKTLASNIIEGGISALNYANIINNLIQSIFVISLITVMFPTISRMVTEHNLVMLKKHVSEVIRVVNLLVIPSTVGIIIFSEPLVRMLFGRGAFGEQAISLTSNALLFYSFGMIGIGLREVLVRIFYSMQDTRTPMINSIIAIILNITLNIILSKYLGLSGLALATSISAIFCTILLFYNLRMKIGSFGIREISISLFRIILASLVMGIIAMINYHFLIKFISENLSLLITIGVGATIYFAVIFLMKVKDADIIFKAIKEKLHKVD